MTSGTRPGGEPQQAPRPVGPVVGRERTAARRPWLISVGLAVFALVPGLARLLVELAGGAVDSSTAGSVAAVVLILHAVSGTLFTVFGAFQFPTASGRRADGLAWHPRIGRLLVPTGLTAALSALWLTVFYSHADGTGHLLYAFRLVFGVAMVASIVVGYAAIRRRHVVRHRAWMIRAYALGLGASTQIVTLGFGGAVLGTGEIATALLTGSGWVINLAVAEWVIRRKRRAGQRGRRRRRAELIA